MAQQIYDTYGAGPTADLMAIVLADAGQAEAARAIRHTLAPLRRDFYYSVYATLRGMAVVAVGGPDEAREMTDVLLPLRDLLAGTPSLSVAVRPVAHVLGDLALMLDRQEEAADHYTRAAEISRLWAAPHWAAEAEEALARISKPTRVSKSAPRGGQVT
jgi:hypothetical protein